MGHNEIRPRQKCLDGAATRLVRAFCDQQHIGGGVAEEGGYPDACLSGAERGVAAHLSAALNNVTTGGRRKLPASCIVVSDLRDFVQLRRLSLKRSNAPRGTGLDAGQRRRDPFAIEIAS